MIAVIVILAAIAAWGPLIVWALIAGGDRSRPTRRNREWPSTCTNPKCRAWGMEHGHDGGRLPPRPFLREALDRHIVLLTSEPQFIELTPDPLSQATHPSPADWPISLLNPKDGRP